MDFLENEKSKLTLISVLNNANKMNLINRISSLDRSDEDLKSRAIENNLNNEYLN